MKKIIIYLLGFIILSMIVTAPPPEFVQTSAEGTGLVIVYPAASIIKVSSAPAFPFDILNSTFSKLTNITTNCSFNIVTSQGIGIKNGSLIYDGNLLYWYFSLNAQETNTQGEYYYYVHCSNIKEQGYITTSYTISYDGSIYKDYSIIAIVIILLGLPFLLIFISSKLDTKADKNSAIQLNSIIAAILWAGSLLSIVVLLLVLYGIVLTFMLSDTILKPIEALFTYGLWTVIIMLFLITFGVGFNLLYKAYLFLGEYFKRRVKR